LLSGDSSITARQLKERADAHQTASLTLTDKMQRARSEQQGQQEVGERQQQGGNGEKME
jgi:hypothetical protein